MKSTGLTEPADKPVVSRGQALSDFSGQRIFGKVWIQYGGISRQLPTQRKTMRFRPLMFLLLALSLTASANEVEVIAIGKVLDDFHDAAAHGDKARYLGHMTDDGVFMGTDEWERWPKQPDFVDYVGSRFTDGSGWQLPLC